MERPKVNASTSETYSDPHKSIYLLSYLFDPEYNFFFVIDLLF